MSFDHDKYRKKLIPRIAEAYTAQAMHEQKLADEYIGIARVHEREAMRLHKLCEQIHHNIGRANEQDLRSYHFLFFGEETAS